MKKSLAFKMFVALLLGLVAGTGFIMLREQLGVNSESWQTINRLLFQDITVKGAENAVGIFYIIGQLFINSLQLIIIPMVFTSITLAICHITDSKKLGRISYKTLGFFFITSCIALVFAAIIATFVSSMGWFDASLSSNVSLVEGKSGANPLLVLLNAMPNNIVAAFSGNGNVLAVVVLAVIVGLCMNYLDETIVGFKKLLQEINEIVVTFLTFVINKFGPVAIFVLLTRTFASYGIDHLKPALSYIGVVTVSLFVYLFIGYPIYIFIATRLNPIKFMKKILKVAMFGFSTSSSAATLPLNKKTTVEELGVSEEIAAFTLPLGMTVNMDGTAIMQVIATIFIASVAGYELTFVNILTIGVLALVASIGTPAAPGAGAVVLFTILSGIGYTNDLAILAYSLILAINRPIEMLVTSLNVIGDSAASVYVAKSENMLDEDVYNA